MKHLVTFALMLGLTLPAAAQQERHYDSQGRSVGTSTRDSQGTTRYYDAQGRSTGTASPNSTGTTTYYSPDGRSIGTISRGGSRR
jgi:YD repeat-containing protein